MTVSRIAIVGTRGHYARVLEEASRLPEAKIVAVAPGGAGDDDVRPLMQGNPAIFPDFQSILQHARPDVLVVCGPLELHAAMSIAAIERGVHVVCEKPVALTLADCDRLSDALAQHPGVHLAGMMFSRYEPGFFTAHQLIQDGAIGEVRLIDARKSYKFFKRPDYFYKRDTFGGTIPWVGSHAIDWMLWFAGTKIDSIYAAHSHDSPERIAQCQFTLDRGILASVSLDYYRPDAAPTHGDDWARVVGTKGIMEIRPDTVQLTGGTIAGPVRIEAKCDRSLLSDFLLQASGHGKALIDGDSTIELTRACLLARESADTGRVLRLE